MALTKKPSLKGTVSVLLCKLHEIMLKQCYAGDYQFDIYRMMKEATRGDWADFHPITNLMVRSLELDASELEADLILLKVASLSGGANAEPQGTKASLRSDIQSQVEIARVRVDEQAGQTARGCKARKQRF